MSFDNAFWTNFEFVTDRTMGLICPICYKGQLLIDKESLKEGDTSDTKRKRKYYAKKDWEDFIEESELSKVFVSLLVCNNPDCQETITCLGVIGTAYKYGSFIDPDTSILSEEQYEYSRYYPLYFWPSIHIINIADSYPEKVKGVLIDSFALFFSDSAACANKIRTCIELLMSELKVKKNRMGRGKRNPIPLHARIVEYQKKNSDIGDKLLAIKWIGNSGSHIGRITQGDVIDAYHILDYCLRKLFNNQSKLIEKITKSVNKKKGPRSK